MGSGTPLRSSAQWTDYNRALQLLYLPFNPVFCWFTSEENYVSNMHFLIANYSSRAGKEVIKKQGLQTSSGSEELVASGGGVMNWVENWSNFKPLKGVVRPQIFFVSYVVR